MISFITAFKKFKEQYDKIQKSALYSWSANDIQAYAPLNEVGLDTSCAGYKITFINEVKRAREIGFANQSPILPDMIQKCLDRIDSTMIALINSDIIIMEGFKDTFNKIIDKYGYDIFMVGTRRDINLDFQVNSPETYKRVQEQKSILYDESTSSDIFITSKYYMRKMVKEMPEFILGRYCWDNWIHQWVGINVLKKLNCTQSIPILHCTHGDYHIYRQEGKKGRDAASSQYNITLWKPYEMKYGTTRINKWPKVELS